MQIWVVSFVGVFHNSFNTESLHKPIEQKYWEKTECSSYEDIYIYSNNPGNLDIAP